MAHLLLKSVLLAGVAAMAAIPVATSVLHVSPRAIVDALGERTAGEMVRYARRRLEGHDRLLRAAQPVLTLIQRRVERPVATATLPTLGKGPQSRSLPVLIYSPEGRPRAVQAGDPVADSVRGEPPAATLIQSAADLLRSVATAKAGDVLEIVPGRYSIRQTIEPGAGGTPARPIVLRAARPGSVTLEMDTVEGFHVTQPYWIFENLVIRGVCSHHADCEHAFHIVGPARGVVVRNNRIEDFNAHVKVNGERGQWPDDGLIQFNLLTDNAPRQTDQPVTPIDLVGASGWQVADNVISHFVKAAGNGISYGVFMKGGGHAGRIERNLLLCSGQDISAPGSRVGLSFGDGGTGPAFCRDGRCGAEHVDGLAANNIVAHCNDFGIDVFKSPGTVIAFNTLINTAGIDVRRAPATARVYGNLLEGRIRARDGAQLGREHNDVVDLSEVLTAPDSLCLTRLAMADPIAPLDGIDSDFDGRPRTRITTTGARPAAPACTRSP
jgi:hypothetical protein